MAIDDEPAFVDVFEDGSGECSGDGVPGMDKAKVIPAHWRSLPLWA
jgi:hypothetical protein